MKLSPHFSLEEFLVSATADRMGIKNVPDAKQLEALKALAVNIMEPLRVSFGAPVSILSGLRVAALNAVTPGSSNTSQHTLGEACDFRVRDYSVADVTHWLSLSGLPFDQLILEFASESNPASGWTHVSFSKRSRRQVLTASRSKTGKTVYSAGLPSWVASRPLPILKDA